jgi:hypothetical protein
MHLANTLFFIGFASTFTFVDSSSTFRTHHDKAPRVTLDYATYEGTAQSTGINEFLGMRFAGSILRC